MMPELLRALWSVGLSVGISVPTGGCPQIYRMQNEDWYHQYTNDTKEPVCREYPLPTKSPCPQC